MVTRIKSSNITDGSITNADLATDIAISTTGNVTLGQNIVFEGATADSFETTLTTVDPTADRTVSIPNATGTLISHGMFSGDATVSTVGALTLSTVNSNVGQFGSATAIPVVTVNAKGLVSAISTSAITTSLTVGADSGSDDAVALASDVLNISGGSNITTTVSNNDISIALDASPTITTPIITEIDSGSTITLDATTDIVLDAGGADVILKDDGTIFGGFSQSAGQLVIKSSSSSTPAITMSGANVTIAGNLTVSGTETIVDSTTVSIQNAFVFEGATADTYESTLTTVDPTADRTIKLPNATGTLITHGMFSGDATIADTGAITLSTVNSNVGSAGSSTAIPVVTVNAKGLVTAVSTAAITTSLTVGADTGTNDAVALASDVLDISGGSNITTTVSNNDISVALDASPSVTNLAVGGTVIFEGSTADSFETTLQATDPSADRTITLQNASGTLAFLTDVTGGATPGNFTTISLDNNITFEGGTDDSFETTLAVAEPTADRTVTIPDVTGTIALLTATQTLTNKTIDLGNNTLTGSIAEFNTALQSESFATLGGTETLVAKTLTSPVLNTGVTGSAVADEDDMSSNSATKLATQQSIKAYVDTRILTEDTIAELNDTTITSPGDGSLLFYDTATSKWIDNVISGDATVADTGAMTLATVNSNVGQAGSSTAIPVVTVNAKGLVTAVSTAAISSALTVAADSGSNDAVTVGTDTLTFAGGTNITTTVSNNQISTALDASPAVTSLVFEGATADSFETTLAVADPTADRTLTLPNSSGTLGLASQLLNATSRRGKFVATNGQTTFTGSDANGLTLAYDAGYLDVYLNGVHLDPADYTASNGTSIVLGSGAATGDILYVVAFNIVASVSNDADDITAGTLAGQYIEDNAITLAKLAGIARGKIIYGDASGDPAVLSVGSSGQVLKSDGTDISWGAVAASGATFVFEGATADSFETTLTATDPTADRTITLPNVTGTVSLVAGTETLTNKTLTSPVLNTGVSGSAVKDEDNMASDSATHLATQQSIKAYVDTQIATEDTIAELNDTTITGTPADNEVLAYDSSSSKWINQTPAEASLASLTGTETLTNKTLASPTFTTNFTIGSATITEAELEILDGATVTTTELNIMDGDTSASSVTLADADRMVVNDNGTMKQVAVTDMTTYIGDPIAMAIALG